MEIRRKGTELRATFTNIQTAELWALYKEDLIDEIHSFNPDIKEMITLENAIDLKYRKSVDDNLDKRTCVHILGLKHDFKDFLSLDINKLNYNNLLVKAKQMLTEVVYKGGNRELKTGLSRIQAPITVLNKFRTLNSVINLFIKEGVNIENDVSKVVLYLRKEIKSG